MTTIGQVIDIMVRLSATRELYTGIILTILKLTIERVGIPHLAVYEIQTTHHLLPFTLVSNHRPLLASLDASPRSSSL